MHLRGVAIPLVLLLPAAAWGGSVWFTLDAGANLPYDPLGIANDVDTSLYASGGGATLRADYELPFAPWFLVEALVGFDLMQVKTLPGFGVGMLTAAPGAGISLRLSPRLRLSLAADAGYTLASYNGARSGALAVLASARVGFLLNQSFAVVTGASYKYYTALYSGVEVFLGASFRVSIEDM